MSRCSFFNLNYEKYIFWGSEVMAMVHDSLFIISQEEDFISTVKESQQIERVYASYFDEIIVNDSFEDTYRQLRKSLNELTSEQQWVPVNWVY